MAEEKSNADVMALVETLQAKVEALEGGIGGSGAEPNRYSQERESRKAERELRRYSESDGRSGNPRPTSPRRVEELKIRSTVLPAATTPRPQPAAPAPGGGMDGDTVEIVVVDNGEFKTGKFYIEGALVAV